MSTIFVFHGGGLKKELGLKRNVYKTLSDLYPKSGNVTMVYHAIYEDKWSELFEKDIKEFSLNGMEVNRFILGSKDINELKVQIQNSVGLFIRGGYEPNLLSLFTELLKEENILKEKIIFGSSAGCNIFSKYIYSNDLNSIYEGLGVINYKSICHFIPVKADRVAELTNHGESLPILLLPENTYTILYLNL